MFSRLIFAKGLWPPPPGARSSSQRIFRELTAVCAICLPFPLFLAWMMWSRKICGVLISSFKALSGRLPSRGIFYACVVFSHYRHSPSIGVCPPSAGYHDSSKRNSTFASSSGLGAGDRSCASVPFLSDREHPAPMRSFFESAQRPEVFRQFDRFRAPLLRPRLSSATHGRYRKSAICFGGSAEYSGASRIVFL